ncbi:hypothetical protein [Marinobacterium rhizophilum]|uniref:Uncharacterized protein n=1 Tax=Marinobacterium rhizophilum TaxID=420402 RepID=A0ABY5HNA1_9GAMM|nr:hypothetical protein [Marinobacterium rhizophilum]UTW12739.1 hypothetical protein KDW95_03400 [Marinobacterium rhizophilum]
MNTRSHTTTVLRAIVRFVALVIAMLWVPLAVSLDTGLFNGEVSETSVTELSQEALLLSSSVLFWILSARRPFGRGFYTLVAGFFSCLFIREQDAAFDQISHGFWVYPALLVAILTLILAAFQRKTIMPAMAAATHSVPFTHILIGLAILLFFSRVLGTGSVWELVLPAPHDSLAKNIVQEGLELLGYILIFYGTLLFRRSSKLDPR